MGEDYVGKATAPGRSKNSEHKRTSNPNSQAGIDETTGPTGLGQSISTLGSDWEGRNISGIVAGGIVGQLISLERDRLAEMEECVLWYQNQVMKSQERLKAWEKLIEDSLQVDSE